MTPTQKALYRSFLGEDFAGKKKILNSIFEEDSEGAFCFIVVEALRSNTTDLFEHAAFLSDYPSRFFSENEFNQMVLKAIFLDLDIQKIKNLETRINPKLTQMIQDYKEERVLAARPVPKSVETFLS